ncbi:MAG: A/G-specific adenine glycosylase [Chitinophagales bacterium]
MIYASTDRRYLFSIWEHCKILTFWFHKLHTKMEITTASKKYFTTSLTAWHETANNRSLPWKREKDPYKIWLSEVILQQTRAQQGLPYYLRFIEAYPTIQDMAAADEEQAFRLWQGLGYYNRCKNMLATARYISNELRGRFPGSYEELLKLKGIGPYTAAAIASFASGLPYSVVDGNVYRVLARYFGLAIPFDTTDGKKAFSSLAQELLDKKNSAAYNQAIMDLGATVCTPRNPLCDQCPLQKKCIAYHDGLITILPVRSKKQSVRKRYFHYLLLKWKDTIWIHKRTGSDIWENLYEPYLIENSRPLNTKELLKHKGFKEINITYINLKYEGNITQRLTHQVIDTRFFSVYLAKKPKISALNSKWSGINSLKKTAFPKTLVSFLENNLYF